MKDEELKSFLDAKVALYNRPAFIGEDPVSVPHQFSRLQDIEIAGFFAAIFSWGNRRTIIQKSRELLLLMDNSPYEFCLHHTAKDLRRVQTFRHRTFNGTDLLYFLSFFRRHYREEESLESAFTRGGKTLEEMLAGFHRYFFSGKQVPERTRKHIATPERGSTCKRLNMFLRWMVRRDNQGVDFGCWQQISPALLICPVDLHVARVARRLGILHRKQTDWRAAWELTGYLRTLDPEDPVKYDFALFGMGVMEKFAYT